MIKLLPAQHVSALLSLSLFPQCPASDSFTASDLTAFKVRFVYTADTLDVFVVLTVDAELTVGISCQDRLLR